MSSPTSAQASGRYIIRAAEPGKLNEFIQGIQPESGIEVLDLIGPKGEPHTAVVAMRADTASALEQSFRASKQFTIEPDRPLSLFGDA